MDLSNIAPNFSLDLKADAVEYLIRETFKNHVPGYEVDKVVLAFPLKGMTEGSLTEQNSMALKSPSKGFP